MYRYTDIYMYICHMLWLLLSWQQTTNTHTHTQMSNNAGNPREFTNYQSCLSRWAQNTKAQLIFTPYTVATRPQGNSTNLRTLLEIYWKPFQFSSTNSFYCNAKSHCNNKCSVSWIRSACSNVLMHISLVFPFCCNNRERVREGGREGRMRGSVLNGRPL